MPRTKAAAKTSPKPARDRRAESQAAKANLARRVGEIAAARKDGTLGDDYIKLAQAMIMCTLPYSQTEERQITRRARLGDRTYLQVCNYRLVQIGSCWPGSSTELSDLTLLSFLGAVQANTNARWASP